MIKGFPGYRKFGRQEFVTISPQGSDRSGMDVLPKAIYQVNPPAPIVAEAIDDLQVIRTFRTEYNVDPTLAFIKSTGHSFRIGDVLRFRTANANFNKEMSIVQIIDADHVLLGGLLSVDPTGTDFFHMRHVTLTINEAGSLAVSAGPLEYIFNSTPTQVVEDTATPLNNRPLPTRLINRVIDVTPPIDISADNIPASSSATGLEIVASTSDIARKIQTIEDIGEYIGLYSGADGALVLEAILPIAGGEVDVNIPLGTRLSIKHMKDSAITTETFFAANIYG